MAPRLAVLLMVFALLGGTLGTRVDSGQANARRHSHSHRSQAQQNTSARSPNTSGAQTRSAHAHRQHNSAPVPSAGNGFSDPATTGGSPSPPPMDSTASSSTTTNGTPPSSPSVQSSTPSSSVDSGSQTTPPSVSSSQSQSQSQGSTAGNSTAGNSTATPTPSSSTKTPSSAATVVDSTTGKVVPVTPAKPADPSVKPLEINPFANKTAHPGATPPVHSPYGPRSAPRHHRRHRGRVHKSHRRLPTPLGGRPAKGAPAVPAAGKTPLNPRAQLRSQIRALRKELRAGNKGKAKELEKLMKAYKEVEKKGRKLGVPPKGKLPKGGKRAPLAPVSPNAQQKPAAVAPPPPPKPKA